MASALPTEFRTAVADEAALRTALEDADIVPQLMVHAQLSGNTTLLEAARPYVQGGWNFMEQIPPALRTAIRESLIETLKALANTADAAHADVSPGLFGQIMSAGAGALIPDDYVTMLMEEIGAEKRDARSTPWRRPVPKAAIESMRVVIIGAGLSGLCMGIKLREAGIAFVIYEKNDAVGGTWYENSYPGCGVDIPNHCYSFSFERKPDWSRHFAGRDELWRYLEDCADKYDIRRDIRFGTEVTAARFEAGRNRWSVTVVDAAGRSEVVEASVLIPSVGQLNRPSVPDIPGLKRFAGPVFHTAQWDHGVDLRGKRVALVGTGASGMQVGPSIVDDVSRLLVFQRSRHWAFPHPNYHLEMTDGMKWALEHIPFFATWYRFLLFWASGDLLHPMLQVDPQWTSPDISLNAENHKFREKLLAHLHAELADRPDLIPKVVPTFPPYGKRMLRDNRWYQMLKRHHVELIDGGIARIEADAIVDAGGVRHEVDVIVLATGFQASRMLWPMDIAGRDGVTIRDVWGEDDPRAFLGISVPRFPNMFLLQGPNTVLSHGGSMFFHSECQVRYIMQCLREMIEGGQAAMECREAPYTEYNRRVDEAHSRMVWTHRGVKNWYKNAAGRVTALSPWRLVDYWKLTAALNPSDYKFDAAAGDRTAGS